MKAWRRTFRRVQLPRVMEDLNRVYSTDTLEQF